MAGKLYGMLQQETATVPVLVHTKTKTSTEQNVSHDKTPSQTATQQYNMLS